MKKNLLFIIICFFSSIIVISACGDDDDKKSWEELTDTRSKIVDNFFGEAILIEPLYETLIETDTEKFVSYKFEFGIGDIEYEVYSENNVDYIKLFIPEDKRKHLSFKMTIHYTIKRYW